MLYLTLLSVFAVVLVDLYTPITGTWADKQWPLTAESGEGVGKLDTQASIEVGVTGNGAVDAALRVVRRGCKTHLH